MTTLEARPAWRRHLVQVGFVSFLAVALLILNLVVNTPRFRPANLGTTLGLAAPLVLAAMAAAPPILGGRGGIDISIGPLMGVVNVTVVRVLFMNGIDSPLATIGLALAIGLAVGACNGFLVTVVRLQPIVATLGTFLILSGLAPFILAQPSGSAPRWLVDWSHGMVIVPFALVLGGWLLFRRTPAYRALMATGGSERAAYTAGVPVSLLRFSSFVAAGVVAAIAALALTALISSGDPTVGPTFTLKAIAAVALGGVSLAGGRGGLGGAVLGAGVIFMVELALTAFRASTFALNMVFGLVLVVAVVANGAVHMGRLRR